MTLWKRGKTYWTYVSIDGVRHAKSTNTGNRRQAELVDQKFREELNLARHGYSVPTSHPRHALRRTRCPLPRRRLTQTSYHLRPLKVLAASTSVETPIWAESTRAMCNRGLPLAIDTPREAALGDNRLIGISIALKSFPVLGC